MKLYFGNLSPDMNDAQLSELVTPYGKPYSANVVVDRETKRSRGFGFVEFGTDSEAKAAMAGLGGKEVSGRALIVNEAKVGK